MFKPGVPKLLHAKTAKTASASGWGDPLKPTGNATKYYERNLLLLECVFFFYYNYYICVGEEND